MRLESGLASLTERPSRAMHRIFALNWIGSLTLNKNHRLEKWVFYTHPAMPF